ncbi:general stress protein [Nitriliruptoraceae bacterium ZYF776]|nr:general stress protein [Profundirhabdus halotolerans]
MDDQDTRTLEEALDGERIVMLTTEDLRARPMSVQEVDGRDLWFLTDGSAGWVAGLRENQPVAATVSDPGDGVFVSLTGRAATTRDDDVLDRLWDPAMEAWFDGRDDPNLVALRITAEDGEYWDGPDTGIGRVVKGLTSVVTGEGRRIMGEQGDVAT